MSDKPVVRYYAAGGVVVDENGRFLLLDRPSREEVRLPKGHIDPGETAAEAALRETAEESGYAKLEIVADLGEQVVEFDYQGEHIIRNERYFLMRLTDPANAPVGRAEKQFEPRWATPTEALAQLSFAAEREWIRRAQQAQ